MTIAARIANLQTERDWHGRRADFLRVCRYLALGSIQESPRWLAEQDHAPERVVEAIKAASDPLTVSTTLSPFQLLAGSFLESLAGTFAFDTMLSSMLNLPLRARVVAATSTVTGNTLAERDVKRVGSLSLSASDLDIAKVGALIVLTAETLKFGGDGATRFLELELRRAIGLASDTLFLSILSAAATSTIASSGSSGSAMRFDLRALLQNVTLGATSRPFLITTPDIAAAWATIGDSGGGVVFPDATWSGGSAAGVPIIASDGCAAGEIILADATGIAAGQEGLRIERSEHATVQASDAPDSPPSAATGYVSLWQLDLVGLLAERFISAKVVRSNAVAKITGASYAGNSP